MGPQQPVPGAFAPVPDQNTDVYAQMSQAQGAPSAQPTGRMVFNVRHSEGQEGQIDEHDIVNQLRQAGYQPTGISGDGMQLHLVGSNGEYKIDTDKVLKNLGWEVTGFQPQGANLDHVDMGLRFLIESPGIRDDDHAKRAVIESKLSRMIPEGQQPPKVVGSGSDWYAFDPNQNKWFALTNKPGMDLSDISQVGTHALGMLGSGVGMALGAPAGIPGMMAGSVGGGALGNMVTNIGSSLADDSFDQALEGRGLGENLKSAGVNAFGDALAGGLGGIIGKAAPSLMSSGLASRGLRGGGRMAEELGRTMEGAGKFMSEGLPKEFGQILADPTGISLYSQLAQLPRDAVAAAPKAMGWAGQQLKGVAPGAAQKLEDISARLLRKQIVDNPKTMGAKFNELYGTGMKREQPAMATDVMGNLADYLKETGRPGAGFARATGRGVENLGRVGDVGMKGVGAVYTGATKGIQYGGAGLRSAGRGARSLGEGLQGIETPMVLKGASEELMSRLKRREAALKNQGYTGQIVPENWAYNDKP